MNLSIFQNQWMSAFLINFTIISFAQRYPLLTTKGWIHSAILGTILYACFGWKGWLAVSIYLLLGTLVTKLGFSYKKSLGIAEGRDGRRGPENVWGSAATGTILALVYALFDYRWQYFIFIGFASSFSAKLADTFGSEIGKRWGRKTFLINNLRPVSPGTDGAISLEGTLASFIGSLLMSLVMISLSFLDTFKSFGIVVCSGFLATIMESFFGALFQRRIGWMTNELVNFIQTSFAAIFAIYLALIL